MLLKRKNTINNNDNLILIINENSNLSFLKLRADEKKYLAKEIKRGSELIYINQYSRWLQFINIDYNLEENKLFEKLRLIGNEILIKCNQTKSILIKNCTKHENFSICVGEGAALGNYIFNKYKSSKNLSKLQTIYFCNETTNSKIIELQNLVESVYLCRDLINTPFSHLKAMDLAHEAGKLSKYEGVNTTILKRNEIQKLKMGGLLAVNQGSLDQPTFSIIHYKPKKAKNKKPLIIVGKGIVYDTGGLSLKPTLNSMDIMKVDMGGAACVIGAINAIAKNKLNVNIIGLIPATDNRPSGNAYAPGDVIKMHSGKTVEVLNTDAEGRMILADALSYAKKYNPKLVIDLATLTGSAARAIGHFGIVSMHKNAEKEHTNLETCGNEVFERLAQFPFWDDYDELIKSDIADIKNIGGSFAGAITAGKFLAFFTSYPFIHLDIAGATYVKQKYGYRGKGATGIGVRLLYSFVKKYYS